ncbi:START domain-containing protein [Marinobacter sp. 1Y8]
MRLTTRTRFLAFIATLAITSGAAGSEGLPPEDGPWDLRKESDGIQIYTTDYAGSNFKAFKAVTVLNASIEQVMAVMTDSQSCQKWVHNCLKSKAIDEGDFYDRYAYSVNDMPWPVEDRDYVLRIRTHGDKASGEVVMTLNAVPNAHQESDEYQRIDKSDTLYRFEPVDANKTRITWVQHTEPNGSIPSWLANSLVVDIPMKSIKNLEKVAQQPAYANYELIYDNNGQLSGVKKTGQSEGDGE